MALIQNLLPTVYKLRSLGGKFGARPFTVSIVTRSYSDSSSPFTGPYAGEDPNSTSTTEITEADGYAPQVEMLDGKAYSAGYPVDAEIKIGPVTPSHSGNGTDIDDLLFVDDANDDDCYLLVTGPGMASGGSRYSIVKIDTTSPIGYMIFAKRIAGGS